MATYVIGDIQGCDDALARLLARAAFDPARDRLWFAGDLVNRGPDSLGVLRRVRGLGEAAVTVLGNHDLHLLARDLDLAPARRRDTLDAVLDAPDRRELVDWLAARPLVHREGGRLLVHAGLLPAWSEDDAVERARAAEAALARDRRGVLRAWVERRDSPRGTFDDPAGFLEVMTGIRMVDGDGRPLLDYAGPPDEAPPGTVPWFRAPGRRATRDTLLFGHWAALGVHTEGNAVALDSGCVWGNRLTAHRLEDGAFVSVPATVA